MHRYIKNHYTDKLIFANGCLKSNGKNIDESKKKGKARTGGVKVKSEMIRG